MTRTTDLDALFAGRPWWEGSAIQFLCRLHAYGGQAFEGQVSGEPARFMCLFHPGAGAQAYQAWRDHRAEITALLERCPERRFPWWTD